MMKIKTCRFYLRDLKKLVIFVCAILLCFALNGADAGCYNPSSSQILLRVNAGSGKSVWDGLSKISTKAWDHYFNKMGRKVRFLLYKNKKQVVDYLFDGRGSTPSTWFTRKRLEEVRRRRQTNVKDAPDDGSRAGKFFNIKGKKAADGARLFFVNKQHGGCRNDKGWLVVLDRKDPCDASWFPGATRKYPMIAYSKNNEANLYSEAANWDFADTLMIIAQDKGQKSTLLCQDAGKGMDPVTALRAIKGWEAKFKGQQKTIRLSFHKLNDISFTRIVDLRFDGQNSTATSWFSRAKLQKVKSGPDVTKATGKGGGAYFSLAFGKTGDGKEIGRQFFINKSYGGCANDWTWLVVLARRDPCKQWFPGGPTKFPIFAYAKRKDAAKTSEKGKFGFAEKLTIDVV